uniref:hypothetical protein n=1 Tax=Rhodopirellula europaea TaxID=1263866 RepID=UPI003D265FD8
DEEAVTRRWVPRQSMDPQSESNAESQASSDTSDSDEIASGSDGWFEWSIPVPRNFNDKSLLIGRCFHRNQRKTTRVPRTTIQRVHFRSVCSAWRMATSQTCELLIDSDLQLARPVANLVGIPTADTDTASKPFRYRYETSPHVIVASPSPEPNTPVQLGASAAHTRDCFGQRNRPSSHAIRNDRHATDRSEVLGMLI